MSEFTRHPVSAIYRDLSETEWADLSGSIKRDGQANPIWVVDGQVIDGWHRYLACQELGIEPVVKEFTGSDIPGFVRGLQDGRRHESKADRDRRILAMRAEGKSTTQIGEEVGVNHSTVVRVLKRTCADAQVDLPDEVVGKDGKVRKARVAKPSVEAPVEPAAVRSEAPALCLAPAPVEAPVPSEDEVVAAMKAAAGVLESSCLTAAERGGVMNAFQKAIDLLKTRVDQGAAVAARLAELAEEREKLDAEWLALDEIRRSVAERESRLEVAQKGVPLAEDTVIRRLSEYEFRLIGSVLQDAENMEADDEARMLKTRANKAWIRLSRHVECQIKKTSVGELNRCDWSMAAEERRRERKANKKLECVS